ncbi:MAG: (2Fe-2S)-binding protein [Hyphomicrobiales bacterium]|nr:(2Fe-2S)-binding protein [Hyphomicrobiales bacterium]
MAAINFTVNGSARTLNVRDPEKPLLYLLRNELGLKGPKFGCGLGQCGACTVIIDGEAVRSCQMPASALAGQKITTIEGLGTVEAPHKVQAAFIEEQAAQCGYCTNGMVMASAALLAHTPSPSVTEIKDALATNLCRCGTHDRIIGAVLRASGRARG